jgi:diguanylate cyclase (GGDEF)-like protein
MDNCKVLIVEDEALVAQDISMTLKEFGYSVVGMVDSAEASLDAVRTNKPDIVVMDIVLKGNQDGIDAAAIIKNEHDVPVIFLSTHTEDEIIRRATTQVPYGYLLKPFRSIELGILMELTRQRHRYERHLQEKNRMLTRSLIKSRETESRLQEISLIDELTGIYNRRGFYSLAQHQIGMAKRTGRTMLVGFFDLDHMKDINDVHGHNAGDAIILSAVGVLKKTFRSSDILSRWGGDEFVVMMCNAESDDREAIEARIARHIDAYNEKADHPYLLSMSWGIVLYDPASHEELEEIIARADALMYANKGRKRA